MVGGFEPDAKPWVAPDALPDPFEFQLLDEDWDHSDPDGQRDRADPVLAETGIKMFYNGPESFTPDDQFILGEAPERRNFFVAVGFTRWASRVAGGAGRGAGRMDHRGRAGPGPCPRSTSAASPPSTGTTSGLTTGSSEVLGLHYAVPWPNRDWPARRLPQIPAYHLLKQANAGFAARWAGSGRTSSRRAAAAGIEYGWGQQNWQPWSSAEQRAPHRRRPVRPDELLEVPGDRPGRRTGAAVAAAPPMSRSPRPDRLHRDAQRPRHLRGRHHRHPALGR